MGNELRREKFFEGPNCPACALRACKDESAYSKLVSCKLPVKKIGLRSLFVTMIWEDDANYAKG